MSTICIYTPAAPRYYKGMRTARPAPQADSWLRLTAVVMLRLSPEEKAAYSLAAARQGKSLSAWLRDAATAYLVTAGRKKK
jgi:hypothetical protein